MDGWIVLVQSAGRATPWVYGTKGGLTFSSYGNANELANHLRHQPNILSAITLSVMKDPR